MTTEQNKAVYRRWFDEGWSRGNADVADELYSSDYVSHSLPPEFPGNLDGLKMFVHAFRAGMPDLHFTVEDIIAEGDRVVGRLIGRGTHDGTLFGIPATGRRAEVSVIVIARFDQAGKWAEDWAVVDQLGMLRQLGAIPEPAPAGA